LTLGLAFFVSRATGSGLAAVGQAGLLYLLIAIGILIGIGRHAPSARFGPADWITLGRATLVCALAGLIGSEAPGGLGWVPTSIGAVVLVLDGLDGWVARRTGTSSAFGACFDREVDTLFVLVLGIVVVDAGTAGVWVLLTGGLRYAFVAGCAIWPWLAADLPPSRRRKTIFGVQVLLLLACLAPVVGQALGTVLAATAVGLVAMSFAIDIRWLYRAAAKR
jgi:phosphatidylglycerophosphate synthase